MWPDAKIVEVKNSSNKFNAFMYVQNNEENYYVLDDTQNAWTNNLSSLDYSLVNLDIVLGVRWDPSNLNWLSKTFEKNDWLWSGVLSQSDVTKIQEFGGDIITNSTSSSQWCGTNGALKYDPTFEYKILEFYSDLGTTPISFDSSNFFIESNNYSEYNYQECALIHSIDAHTTEVKSYKLRIRKRESNETKVAYFKQNKTSYTMSMGYNTLFDENGNNIPYDSNKLYSILHKYSALSEYGELKENNGYLKYYCTNSSNVKASSIEYTDLSLSALVGWTKKDKSDAKLPSFGGQTSVKNNDGIDIEYNSSYNYSLVNLYKADGSTVSSSRISLNNYNDILYLSSMSSSDVYVSKVVYSVSINRSAKTTEQKFNEIKLYLNNGDKRIQDNITSSYTDNVNQFFVYQLYVDEELTTPFKFDYSNEYDIGEYNSDVNWNSFIKNVSELPETTTNNSFSTKIAYVLLDTGELWLCSNNTEVLTKNINTIKVRIYTREQQYCAGYFNTEDKYNNVSLSYGTNFSLYKNPGEGNAQPLTNNEFSTKEIVGVYGSAGNLISENNNNFSWDNNSELRISYNKINIGAINVRTVIFVETNNKK